MKITALILACGLVLHSAYAQDTTTAEKPIITPMPHVAYSSITLDTLLAMDKQKFKGKPVAHFLASPEAKGYTDLVFRTNKGKGPDGLRLKYSSNLYLHIRLVPDTLLQQPAKGEAWHKELLEKAIVEEIGVIYVMHEGKD